MQPAFEKNGMLLLAQLAALVQGGFAIWTGFSLIRLTADLNGAFPGANVPPAVSGILFGFGVTYGLPTMIVGALVIAAAIRVGRPSPVARWGLAIWEMVALAMTLLVLLGGGLFLFPLIVIVFAGEGLGGAPLWAILGLEVLIVYALVLHPATREAFDR